MGPNPSEGLVEEPWRAQTPSEGLGHHLAANPSEGLVEEARMTRMWSLGTILGHLEPNAV